MRKLSLLIPLVVWFCCDSISAQQMVAAKPTYAVTKAVEQVIEEQKIAAIKNDLEKMRQLLADDYISTNASGETRTKEQTLAFYKQSSLKYENIIISDMNLRILSPVSAVANFKVTTKEKYNGEDTSGQFRVTRVFVRRGNRWVVIANHSTSLTQ